ncbi:hypothetical protein NM208_g4832 [Fusarium decemcellulare]|uniref:Uncharacterized protein n=1 Tax=Fusarium decemcellulare TaxID=57161 RepID=A0ACC1SJ73_9HYPO|nr:hypothetical protein NM208_g4832 [Fusarium decemcellulare]
MSGIEIFGLIAGIISTAEIISRAYGGIRSLHGLPEAFHAVGRRLPLLESTLREAKSHVQDTMDLEGDDPEALTTLLNGCHKSTERLKTIFLKLSQSKDKGFLPAYQALVANIGKRGLVESLMSDILKGVAILTSYRVFQTATKHQVEELKTAIEEMSQVDPSLPESMLEEKSTSNTHFGQGNINNLYDGSTQTNIAGNSYSAQGNMSFGGRDMDDDCLTALRVTDPRDDKKRIEETKGGLLYDSYHWILENDDFKACRDGDLSLLWIAGDPGKGKTMSICGIINEMSPETKIEDQNSDKLLSYFFCEAADSRLNNAVSVLRGIIYLLAKQDSAAVSCIQERYRHSCKGLFEDRNAWSALRTVFSNILEALRHETVYLIIDALDECSDERRKLLELVIEESSWPHVKWIVSSRNWPDIRETLNTASHKRRLCLELNEMAVSNAVDSYIRHKVKTLARVKNYDPQMANTVHMHLSSKSQSTFLWVSLACQMLENAMKWETLWEVETFPSGLEPLYERMLDQVQAARKDRSYLYQRIISVMLTVFRPISLDELRPLAEVPSAASDDDSLTGIIGLCGSFLTTRKRILYFVHDSAKRFLMNSPKTFPYDSQEQHYRLFLASLKIMSTSLRRDILNKSDQLQSEDTLYYLSYPCTNWVFHLTQCASDILTKELGINSLIDKFLHKHFLHWLEALGHMESVSAGILSMLELERVLWSHMSQLADLVRDESRFIRYHRRGIEQSPLQAYSALLFSPACSIIRHVYQQEEPAWVTLKPVVEDHWTRGLHSMEGHTRLISSISFSHDGRWLVSASPVRSVAFSRVSYQIASASEDGTIKAWDGERGRCIWTLNNNTDTGILVLSVVFSQDDQFLAAGFSDGQITLHDPQAGSCIRTLQHPGRDPTEISYLHDADPGMSLAISRDGDFLASSDGYSARVWNLKSGVCLLDIDCNPCNENPVVEFSSRDTLGIIDDDGVLIFDLGRCKSLRLKRAGENRFCGISFSPDGSLLAESCRDSPIRIFDTTTWGRVLRLEESPDSVLFSPTGNMLASTSDRRIKMWDLAIRNSTKTRQLSKCTPQSPYEDHLVSFSPDGCFVASFTIFQPMITIWDALTGEFVRDVRVDYIGDKVVTFSPDGSGIAIVNGCSVLVEDTKTGAGSIIFKREQDRFGFFPIKTLVFSPDNRWVAVLMDRDSDIRIWKIEHGKLVRKLKSGSDSPHCLVFSHDGRYLAVCYKSCIRIWDTTLWKVRQILDMPGDVFSPFRKSKASAVFSKDNSWIASSYQGVCSKDDITQINIWRLQDGTCMHTFEIQHDCCVQSLDSTFSRLETTIGTFEFGHGGPHLKGYGISKDGQWILWGTERVLWLPPEFRPHGYKTSHCYVVFSSCKIAIGLASSRILILNFNPDGPTINAQPTSLSSLTPTSSPRAILGHRAVVPAKRRHGQAHF